MLHSHGRCGFIQSATLVSSRCGPTNLNSCRPATCLMAHHPDLAPITASVPQLHLAVATPSAGRLISAPAVRHSGAQAGPPALEPVLASVTPQQGGPAAAAPVGDAKQQVR